MQAKNIIITGGSKGIGRALADQLSKDGHTVIVLSRGNPDLQRVEWVKCDLSNQENIIEAVDGVTKLISSVDVLVHNSGYLVNKPFTQVSYEDLEQSYKVNVFGPFLLTQKLLPIMSCAHIIGISSMGGVNGTVKFPGLSAYSSSKGALITLFELLQEELGDQTGQVFNILALGAVQTEMLSAAFPGFEAPLTAKDMAEFVRWFALNGHKYFKGKVLPVSVSTP
ncbi:MAG: SDR family oxidoreductase [Cryomorphaceae bacterium]|nr:SDR family oxidoreductase [Cryomorphaceae bacterium]